MEGLLALEIDEDLLATCSALGYTDGDQYYKGDECWGNGGAPFVTLRVCLFVQLIACLPACLSYRLLVCLHVCSFICLFVSRCPSVCLSACLTVRLSVHRLSSVSPSVVYLSVTL